MGAHLFEQPPAQHRHPPAAAVAPLASARVQGLDREAPGLARLIDAGELALERLHRRDNLALKRLEPGLRLREPRVVLSHRGFGRHRPRTLVTSRSTCASGVCGKMPCPRLKICALVPNPFSTRSISVLESGAARDQGQGVEIALQCDRSRQRRRRDRGLDGGVEADRSHARHPGEFPKLRRRSAGEGDDPRLRRGGANLVDEGRDWPDAPALEFRRRQDPRPGVEDLQGFRARRELAQQIGGRGVDQAVDQLSEQFRMAVGEEPRRRLFGRAAPGDHVARRPSRARRRSR